MHFAFSFGVQAAEVEVNKLTGEVRVLKIISANDVGMAVNPLGLQGQVEGGVMMGLGNCPHRRIHHGEWLCGHRPSGALSHPGHHAHAGDHIHYRGASH